MMRRMHDIVRRFMDLTIDSGSRLDKQQRQSTWQAKTTTTEKTHNQPKSIGKRTNTRMTVPKRIYCSVRLGFIVFGCNKKKKVVVF